MPGGRWRHSVDYRLVCPPTWGGLLKWLLFPFWIHSSSFELPWISWTWTQHVYMSARPMSGLVHRRLLSLMQASQITHMGSSEDGSMGRRMGVLQAKDFILSMHAWCSGFQRNGWPFFWIAARGPVYADTSGIKCARYCTNPRKHCTSCLPLGVCHSRTRAILLESAWIPQSSIIWPRQSIFFE